VKRSAIPDTILSVIYTILKDKGKRKLQENSSANGIANFTYRRCQLTFVVDDYGKKGSTTEISGSCKPSAGLR